MPFTPTHTLAAVPLGFLWRQPAGFSSMVIGSMVPDWPLYVPFGPQYDLTHSIPGLFISCLPLGLVLALYFQFALKQPLTELLPEGLQRRLSKFLGSPAKLSFPALIAICGAVLVGAASHVFWDSFTHRGTWGVQMFPALSEVALTLGSANFRWYMVLQHGSTFVGMPIFLLLLYAWYRKSSAGDLPAQTLPGTARLFWRVVLLVLPTIVLGHMTWQLFDATTTRSVFRTLFYGVTRSGLLLMIALLVLGLQYLLRNRIAVWSTASGVRRGG